MFQKLRNQCLFYRRRPSPVIAGTLTFALILAVNCAFGLTIKNINAVPGSGLDSGLVTQTCRNEATMVKLAAAFPNSPAHDSLQSYLRQSFVNIRRILLSGTGLKTNAASALLLLYLGDLGLPVYYDSATTLVEKTRRRFPGNEIVCWLQCLCCVKYGEIARGIELFDSLYVSGFHDDAFLSDYSGYVFHALVPAKNDSQSVELKNFITSLPDTFGSSSREWSMVRRTKKEKLPCFMYGASFEIRKPFHFAFQRVLVRDGRSFQLGKVPKAVVQVPPFEEFAERTARVRCRLFIDLEETDGPLFEYLSSRISGKYDSINVTAELKKQHGITLRCYTVPRFYDDNGKYTAIATFDRPFFDLLKQHGAKAAAPEFKKIRYTLVLQSSAEEQEISEVKFQSILDAFFD